MMEPPFFNSHYQSPTPPQFRRAPPFKQPFTAQTTPSPPRKVISIPIHFVNSGIKRSASALKIQKAFRGFRVRNTVKKILELKREVDAVEKKLQERETMAVIKSDGMERLKVNESLMALLFKLDSVRGFNDEIRAFRKAVIRKAILLQELIDSAIDDGVGVMEERDTGEIAVDVEEDGENLEKSDGIVENADVETKIDDGTLEQPEEGADDETKIDDETLEQTEEGADDETKINDETLEKSTEIDEDADNLADGLDDLSKMQVEDDSEKLKEETEVTSAMQVVTFAASDDNWECVCKETEEQKSELVEAGKEDDHGGAEDRQGFRNMVPKEDWFVVGGGEEETKKKEKLLEKMASDNERLVAMVADLCQKNVVQSRLILSLSQRVEQLEKAMNDRLRKKKKKINATLI